MTALARTREELRTNPPQWEAFVSPGDTLVVAPPGSGKTKLLTAKLAQDFLTELPAPYGGACITYSNSAAEELDLRLHTLAVDRRSNLFVGTVHGFALHAVIGPYAPLVGREDVVAAAIATERQRSEFLGKAIAEVYEGSDSYGVEHTMGRRRRHFITDDAPEYGGERVGDVTRRYEQQLRDNNLIDFDDMIRIAVEIVEGHEWVRRVLAARFSKLYIDEYQDLGPGLHRLVEALCFDQDADATLFAVADPDQCIYAFTGADPSLIDELSARSAVKTISLARNYRCRSEIIRHSLTALDHDLTFESDLDGGLVEVHQIEGWIPGQARAAAIIAASAHDHGTPYENIAVISARNRDCAEAAEVFRGAGLPVFIRGAEEYARTPATSMIEGLAAWATAPAGESGIPLAELLRRWQMLRKERGGEPAVDLVSTLLSFKERGDEQASRFIETLVDLGLLDRLRSQQEREEDADAVERMLADYSQGSLAELTVADLGDRALARNRVHILTMHGSKGLEFDLVFILGLDEGVFPFWNATPAGIIQARRQFYVALTRARDEVHLYYTGWRRDRFGRKWEDGPCRFLSAFEAAK